MNKKTKLILVSVLILAIIGGTLYYLAGLKGENNPPVPESESKIFQGNIKVGNKYTWESKDIAAFKESGGENVLKKGINWRYFDKKVTTSELFEKRIKPIKSGWAKALVYNPIPNECVEGDAGFVELYKADDRVINDFCPIEITVSDDTYFYGGLSGNNFANFDRVSGNLNKIKEKIKADTWVLIPLPRKFEELDSTTNFNFLKGAQSDQFDTAGRVDGANIAWVTLKARVFDNKIVAAIDREMDETHYVIDEVSLNPSKEITIVIKGKIDTEWSKKTDKGVIVQTDAGHMVYWAGTRGKIRASLKFNDGKTFFVDASGESYYKTNEEQIIVVVYDGQTMYLYKDGELISSRKVGRILKTATGPTSIGATPEGENYFKGYLKEVSIYNRAFTPDEVAEIDY